ncbi:MAG: DNA polymerase III subunit beta [Patescibacteria group bacterium]
MKLTCSTADLNRALTIVSKAVPLKSSLPILTHMLLSADAGRLTVSATNLETAISMHLEATVETPGALTVPAKLLRELISNLSTDTLSLTVEKERLSITAASHSSKINGITAEDYPKLPTMPESGDYINFDPSNFSSAVSHVSFAAAVDESNPIYSGVFICHDNKVLTLAATNGFRLSEYKLPVVDAECPYFEIVIPSKTLADVARILGSSAVPIKFVLNDSDNLALFESEKVLITVRLLGGSFPDYKKIIPASGSISAEFPCVELYEAIKMSSIFTTEISDPITLVLANSGEIKISVNSAETGEHLSSIPATVVGDLTVSFNQKFLQEFFSNVKYPKVRIETNGNTSPCLLKPLESDVQFLHILMPLKINE